MYGEKLKTLHIPSFLRISGLMYHINMLRE